MLEYLKDFDTNLFMSLRNTLRNPFCDWFFPILTTQKNWYIPIAALTLLSLYLAKKKLRHAFVLALTLFTVGISDMVSHTIKNLVARPRPFVTMPEIHHLVDAYGYSFPSGHATNIFASCVLLSLVYPRWAIPFLVLACAVAFSRVYVGVHYPLDVVGGAILGTCFALLVYRLTLGRKPARGKD